MLWCIAPAPAAATNGGHLRLAEIKHCVEGALHDVGWDHKDLAHAMGFGGLTRIGLYYRQLRTHGLNFNLLTNDPEFFLHLAIRVCLMLGITKERIAKALDIPYETPEARAQRERAQEARDRAIDQRLRRLERLAGVPPADTDPPAEEGSPDATTDSSARARVGRRNDAGAALVAADVDLLPMQVPLQGRMDVRRGLDVRVSK
jgi:DNA-binding transcriptional MerR regulator